MSARSTQLTANTIQSFKHARIVDKQRVFYPVRKLELELSDSKLTKVIEGDRGVAVTRMDTHEIITHASSDYELVLHEHIIDAVEAMFDANGIKAQLFDLHTGGKKGNRMYADYILPSHKISIKGDEYAPFLQVQNSYDKFIVFGMVSGLYRYVCSNGLLMGTRDMVYTTKKHIGENIALEDIAFDVDLWIERLGIAQKRMAALLREPLSKTTIEKVLKEVLEKEKDRALFAERKILDGYKEEFGSNMYALFNALTEYATHVMSDEEVCKNYDKARKVQLAIADTFIGDLSLN